MKVYKETRTLCWYTRKVPLETKHKNIYYFFLLNADPLIQCAIRDFSRNNFKLVIAIIG